MDGVNPTVIFWGVSSRSVDDIVESLKLEDYPIDENTGN
jgi:hypothetical protein